MAACGCRAKTTQFVFCPVLSRGGPGRQASELPPKIKVDITLCAQTLDCVPHRDTFAPAQQQQKSGQNTLPYLTRSYHMDVAQEEFCPNHRYLLTVVLAFFRRPMNGSEFFSPSLSLSLSLSCLNESMNPTSTALPSSFGGCSCCCRCSLNRSSFLSLCLLLEDENKQTKTTVRTE